MNARHNLRIHISNNFLRFDFFKNIEFVEETQHGGISHARRRYRFGGCQQGIQSTKLFWVGKEEQSWAHGSWAQWVIEESLMRCLLFEIDIICQMNLNDHISY